MYVKSEYFVLVIHQLFFNYNFFKDIGSILLLKMAFKKIAEKTVKIISEVIIMKYVQL
jgi:hypothetical protein